MKSLDRGGRGRGRVLRICGSPLKQGGGGLGGEKNLWKNLVRDEIRGFTRCTRGLPVAGLKTLVALLFSHLYPFPLFSLSPLKGKRIKETAKKRKKTGKKIK